MKTCSKCHRELPFTEFTWCKSARCLLGGYHCSRCKSCMAEIASAWQAANYSRAYTKQQAWREANRSQWNGRMAEITKRRYAAKMQRLPAWFDADKVKEVYELATEFREAGFAVDVDHIVPLQGERVSGLHWHGNLRVCLAAVNRSKGNRLSAYHES